MAKQKDEYKNFFLDGKGYDERAIKLESVNQNLHFLTHLVLDDLPKDAHALSVGVGTGTEIIRAAAAFPDWRFTGIEPSEPMLDTARTNLKKAGIAGRCELQHGFLSDLKGDDSYDVVLCIFVTHFVKDLSEREAMFRQMHERLKPKGYVVLAEISADLRSKEFPALLEAWKSLQRFSGAPREQADKILETLTGPLLVLAPEKTESLLKKAGFSLPVQFFQSILIRAWFAQKS